MKNKFKYFVVATTKNGENVYLSKDWDGCKISKELNLDSIYKSIIEASSVMEEADERVCYRLGIKKNNIKIKGLDFKCEDI